MTIRDDVQAVIDGTLLGDIIETFARSYADDVVISENDLDERVGKAGKLEYERQFVANVDFHGAKVGRVAIDGNHAAVQWEFDMTPRGGERIVQRQVAFQTWRDGQVIREVFYDKPGCHRPRPRAPGHPWLRLTKPRPRLDRRRSRHPVGKPSAGRADLPGPG